MPGRGSAQPGDNVPGCQWRVRPHFIVQAWLPMLQRLRHLQTLYVRIAALSAADTTCLLMGLGNGVVAPQALLGKFT